MLDTCRTAKHGKTTKGTGKPVYKNLLYQAEEGSSLKAHTFKLYVTEKVLEIVVLMYGFLMYFKAGFQTFKTADHVL